MYAMHQRIFVIAAVSALLVIAGIVPSWAGLKMEEIRAHFENETGRIWDEADAEEKAGFIKEFYAPPQTIAAKTPSEQPERRKKLVKGRGDENLIEPKLLFFRRAFKKAKGKDWSEATEEERQDFLNVYQQQRIQEISAAQQKAEAERTRRQEQQQRKAEKAARKREQQIAAAEKERTKKQIFSDKQRANRERLQNVQTTIEARRQE